jgi:UDPglucose 6-dehydrogenase
MTRICIVGGGGYVGLGYAVALAETGHDVIGLDIDEGRIARLNRGESPIFETGLPEMLRRNLTAGRLRFTSAYDVAVPTSEIVFLCTGTPSLSDGEADLRQVRSAAMSIGAHLQPGTSTIVVNKSTMPVGAAELVAGIVAEHAPAGAKFAVISNPEFLREGRVLEDILRPDRIVLGGEDGAALDAVAALYEPFNAPIVRTDHRSAELIKYAANAFLATKISFINDIARLCERLGADVSVVAAGIGADERIGPRFLHAGIGFGGSCFPKDVGALTRMAEGAGLHPGLLRSVLEINRDAQRRFVTRAEELLGGLEHREIAVWGLAFKEDTDDLRESPAVAVVEMLVERGAAVRAHDPAALANAARRLPRIRLAEDPYEAARGADAVMLCTPWSAFAGADFHRLASVMRGDLVLDGRNMLDRAAVRAAGLRYEGIGNGKERLAKPRRPSPEVSRSPSSRSSRAAN